MTMKASKPSTTMVVATPGPPSDAADGRRPVRRGNARDLRVPARPRAVGARGRAPAPLPRPPRRAGVGHAGPARRALPRVPGGGGAPGIAGGRRSRPHSRGVSIRAAGERPPHRLRRLSPPRRPHRGDAHGGERVARRPRLRQPTRRRRARRCAPAATRRRSALSVHRAFHRGEPSVRGPRLAGYGDAEHSHRSFGGPT